MYVPMGARPTQDTQHEVTRNIILLPLDGIVVHSGIPSMK